MGDFRSSSVAGGAIQDFATGRVVVVWLVGSRLLTLDRVNCTRVELKHQRAALAAVQRVLSVLFTLSPATNPRAKKT